MKKIGISQILIVLVLLVGCNETEPSSTETDKDTFAGDFDVPTILPTGIESYLENNSEYIFDQDELRTYELILPESALEELDRDPAAEEYVEGMLIFEGDTISPVGIRYKGSIGAFVNCLSGSNPFEPSGEKICTKLSVKVKINWEGRDERFFGLKKLQFHSQNLDPTQMHERLGYYLYRSFGVRAPRSVHSKLYVNGVYTGLYALTEQIDNRFTKYNYDDGGGNLYKEVWPLSENGVPNTRSTFLDALKTNEDDNPSLDIIESFAKEISAAKDTEVQDVISKWMEVDEVIRYVVVDRMIRNDDGVFHWYCGGQSCENHNYYWYEEPSDRIIHLIPWDLDNAFENIRLDVNPVTPIADSWGETRNDCLPFRYGVFGATQRSASCDKLTAGWASYKAEYESLKDEFIDEVFSEFNIDAQLDKWTEQIMEATQDANNLHNDAVSMDQWQGALNSLKRDLQYAREN